MTDRNFLRAEADYLAPPDTADIREAWYETIEPKAIAHELIMLLFDEAIGGIPSGWIEPMAAKLNEFLAINIGDELGILGAAMECNLTYQAFEDSYFEADEPDPDRGRDE